jgi:hypothetical protein
MNVQMLVLTKTQFSCQIPTAYGVYKYISFLLGFPFFPQTQIHGTSQNTINSDVEIRHTYPNPPTSDCKIPAPPKPA